MSASDDPMRVYGFDTSRLPWQKEFIECDDEEVLGSGAFGSGKTRALNEKVYLLLAAYPGNRGLLTRKTYSALTNTTLKSLLDEVIPPSHIVEHNKGDHVIRIQSPFYPASYCPAEGCEYHTDARLDDLAARDRECPACDSNLMAVPLSELYYEGLNTGNRPGEMPEKIAGMNLGFVGVDEGTEITERDWEMLLGRLRLRRLDNPFVPVLPLRQIFSATNPADPNHWLYKRFYEEGVGTYIESSTEDNPYNPPDYLARLEDRFGGTEYKRYVQGVWEGYEGLVYDDFRDSVHVLDPLDVPDVLGSGWSIPEETRDRLAANLDAHGSSVRSPDDPEAYTPARLTPPEDVPLLLAIDWGYRPDPLVVQMWAATPTHGLVLYREWFRTRTLPDEMAREVLAGLSAQEVSQVKLCVADHDSGDRRAWLDGAKAYAQELRDEGAEEVPDYRRLRTTAAKKDRTEGVQEVKRRLRPDDNGRAGLHFVRGARVHPIDRHLRTDKRPGSTLQEIRGYRWKDDSEDPQDTDDHGMDTMRYAAYTLKRLGGYRRLSSRGRGSVHKS